MEKQILSMLCGSIYNIYLHGWLYAFLFSTTVMVNVYHSGITQRENQSISVNSEHFDNANMCILTTHIHTWYRLYLSVKTFIPFPINANSLRFNTYNETVTSSNPNNNTWMLRLIAPVQSINLQVLNVNMMYDINFLRIERQQIFARGNYSSNQICVQSSSSR